jgi:hypothetical protein
MKQILLNNLKNIYGWRTPRKIIVISVDDYGNVRLDSNKARQNMDEAGLKVHSRFDAYDTLETREDLERLYDVLDSVKGKNNRSAVFTPFALPCNIDFERMAEEGYVEYQYELLPETYNKLSQVDPLAYEGTWALWQEGINKGIIVPQFHGREHLNLKVFKEKLDNKDNELMIALKNRSYTSLSNSGFPNISYTAAFEFEDFKENEVFPDIISDGLKAFEKVYGYRSVIFNPPGGREHPIIHKILKENGIRYLDTPLVKNEHQGNGKYKKKINYTGKKNKLNMSYLVRNVVFEPTHDRGFDWVNYTMKQIEVAFRWHRPAIISSHRVNFCGHIDYKNRKTGLDALKELLQKVAKKWPEVEFMAANELANLIKYKKLSD